MNQIDLSVTVTRSEPAETVPLRESLQIIYQMMLRLPAEPEAGTVPPPLDAPVEVRQ